MLSARFFMTWWRSPINLLVQLAQYIFFAFMLGAATPAFHLHATGCCKVTAEHPPMYA